MALVLVLVLLRLRLLQWLAAALWSLWSLSQR
jgi:hypothetical protein